MRRTRIKFCGLTQENDINKAILLGVDAIGIVFVPKSPRCISIEKAQQLRKCIPPFVSAVALVMDQNAATVQTILDAFQPDLLQFHGSESQQYCQSFNKPYIKAIAMGQHKADTPALNDWENHPEANALLFDAHAPGEQGGQGEVFDWNDLLKLKLPQATMLAGGLHPDNVRDAIKNAQPFAVDVSSGIELSPGVKDHHKMQLFVAQVQKADEEKNKSE